MGYKVYLSQITGYYNVDCYLNGKLIWSRYCLSEERKDEIINATNHI